MSSNKSYANKAIVELLSTRYQRYYQYPLHHSTHTEQLHPKIKRKQTQTYHVTEQQTLNKQSSKINTNSYRQHANQLKYSKTSNDQSYKIHPYYQIKINQSLPKIQDTKSKLFLGRRNPKLAQFRQPFYQPYPKTTKNQAHNTNFFTSSHHKLPGKDMDQSLITHNLNTTQTHLKNKSSAFSIDNNKMDKSSSKMHQNFKVTSININNTNNYRMINKYPSKTERISSKQKRKLFNIFNHSKKFNHGLEKNYIRNKNKSTLLTQTKMKKEQSKQDKISPWIVDGS